LCFCRSAEQDKENKNLGKLLWKFNNQKDFFCGIVFSVNGGDIRPKKKLLQNGSKRKKIISSRGETQDDWKIKRGITYVNEKRFWKSKKKTRDLILSMPCP